MKTYRANKRIISDKLQY